MKCTKFRTAAASRDDCRPAIGSRSRGSMGTALLFGVGALLAILAPTTRAQGDLYIKDTPADTGVEPNPDTGPMWVSQDIWVRNSADPNYDPRPYPSGSPTWIPAAHENPEHDDPKYGFPSYIYVRVHNRSSTQASTGTERLRVYWAKASTGLSWPTQWVDYIDNTCGSSELYGMEVTKPRKNAATASVAERNAYLAALLDIDADAALQFSDGVQYWDKQNTIHDIGGAQHGVPGFLPWHREFLNRLEILMRESDPTLTLMYWDWTTDPRTGFGVNLFTNSFMGASSGAVGAPLGPLQPPNLSRNIGVSAFSPDSDAAITGETNYPDMWDRLERTPNHNSAHGYIGGPFGNISSLSTAAQDPFFFFLHGNVDKIWAEWQRNPANPERLDNATTYGTSSGHSSITNNMSPWDGGTGVSPWTNPSEQSNKAGTHYSVVSPPVYDTAPLVVPVLQPGESCVVQIPWYPPNPSLFNCFGDPGHFCLLARIETATGSPFGMTTPEGVSVSSNTRNNNNIAWKNITVVDNFARLKFLSAAIVRNFFPRRQVFRLRFRIPEEEANRPFFNVGRVTLLAPRKLVDIWEENDRIGEGVTVGKELPNDAVELILAGDHTFMDLPLEPKQSFPIGIQFGLHEPIKEGDGRRPYTWDFEQVIPEDGFFPETVVGGQRFTIDLSKFRLIGEGSEWAYDDRGQEHDPGWRDPDFDDSDWKRGRAPLGFGDPSQTVVDGGPADDRHPAIYFRKTFQIDDPGFYHNLVLRLCVDDGAAVYLNGEEIARRNLPDGEVEYAGLAPEEVKGLRECIYWEIPLDKRLPLREGRNLLAVEVHQASTKSDDLHFDLELCANGSRENLKPAVKILNPWAGASFAPDTAVRVHTEALDQDGEVKEVRLLVDGELVAARQQVPYRFELDQLEPGSHLLTALAIDDRGERATHSVRISVAKGLPPLVSIVHPMKGARIQPGEAFPVRVEIEGDPSGPVEEVRLYLRSGGDFATGFALPANGELVGTDDTPPYLIEVAGREPGHYMLQAAAVDAAGNVGISNHAHVMVVAKPFVQVERVGESVVIRWGPEGAHLEKSSSLTEPWTPVQGAVSPLVLPLNTLDPAEQWYRSAVPLGDHGP